MEQGNRVGRPSVLSDYLNFLLLIGLVVLFPILVRSYFLMRLGLVVCLYAINVTGMTLLTRYAGVVSLGHSAFFALGAYISAIFTTRVGLNAWAAMALAAGVTTLCAYFFAVPFLKLRRVYLAMATLGLGEVTYLLAKNLTTITNGVSGIPGIPYLAIGTFEFKQEYKLFYLFGCLLLFFTYLVHNIGQTRIGRAYHAIRTNEMAAKAMGIDVQRELSKIFCLSAFTCSLSGSLLAHFITFVSPESFTIDFSFALLIIVIIGGANVWAALLTAVALFAFSEAVRGFQDLSSGLYGLLLILALFFLPDGLASVVSPKGKPAKRRASFWSEINPYPSAKKVQTGAGDILELHGITKSFGGTKALSGVSFGVSCNRIVSVIGPNGAGKTTLLNVVSGFLKPKEGKVLFKGIDITWLEPHEVAALGLGRTFQIVNLFTGMTVIENVMVGGHLKGGSGIFASGLNLRRARVEEAAILRSAMESLEFLGLTEKGYDVVDTLPFGEQRLVEIARALTMRPDLLLLDEPSAGLNPAETERLSQILRALKDMGITIILVEHNMPLVMSLSDMIHVLDFGSLIASGTPSEIVRNEEVVRAYLGSWRGHAT